MGGRLHARSVDIDGDGAGILHQGNPRAEFGIDRAFDPFCCREVRRFQRQPQHVERGKLELNLAFHPRAGRDAPGCRNALHDTRCIAFCRDATSDDRALGDGIDLTIRSVQGGHDQRATEKAFRITDGRNRHVYLASGPGEGGQGGCHEDRRDILRAEFFPRHVRAQPLQEIGHDLFGERRVPDSVTSAVQADDQSIAHQIIPAHPVEFDEILDADRLGESGGCQKQNGGKGAKDHLRNSVRLSRDTRAVTR